MCAAWAELSGKVGSVLAVIDRWLLARAILFSIALYRIALSWMFRGSCRFLPTCSAYAAEAVERYGASRGLWMALARLARCHPFSAGGVDPVP